MPAPAAAPFLPFSSPISLPPKCCGCCGREGRRQRQLGLAHCCNCFGAALPTTCRWGPSLSKWRQKRRLRLRLRMGIVTAMSLHLLPLLSHFAFASSSFRHSSVGGCCCRQGSDRGVSPSHSLRPHRPLHFRGHTERRRWLPSAAAVARHCLLFWPFLCCHAPCHRQKKEEDGCDRRCLHFLHLRRQTGSGRSEVVCHRGTKEKSSAVPPPFSSLQKCAGFGQCRCRAAFASQAPTGR